MKVIDNVIPDKYSQFLFDEICRLKWTFVPNLSHSDRNDTNYAGFSFNFFLHKMLSNNKEEVRTPEYSYIIPLLLQCFEKLDLDRNIENVFRSRVRLTIQKDKEEIESPHVDYPIPHLVLLYYINTTDGDTLFLENNKIVDRVSPKRGRCVLFDGSVLHSSSSSTLSPRLILNNNIFKS